MTATSPPPLPLPDPDRIRERIAHHDAEARTLRRLLRLVNQIARPSDPAATSAAAPSVAAGSR